MTPTPDHDPGIENEPHLAPVDPKPDPSESRADHTLEREARRGHTERLAAMHSIIEEPFDVRYGQDHEAPAPGTPDAPGSFCARCGYDLRGSAHTACPECGFDPAQGYGAYLLDRIESTTAGYRLAALLFALAIGGVLSVLGALAGQLLMGFGFGLTVLAVTGPLYEELMKVMVVLMMIELRPYLFRHSAAIWAATLGSAAVFATLENLIYLNVYIPDPTPGMILWRWSACSALHVGCTAITTVGLVRMWRTSVTELRPPSIAAVYPFLVAAIIVHGLYNATVVFAQLAGLSF